MTIRKVKLSEVRKMKGKSREKLLANMSAEEINRRAKSDPDNPPLTDKQLKEFKIPQRKERKNEKN